jgi:hypothetical protein
MTPSEAHQAFRHRVLMISWELGKIGDVVAGERAKAYAKEQGPAFVFLAAVAAPIRSSLFLGRGASIITILMLPAYWLLISVASWVAVLQYFSRGMHWAKTPHGVSRVKPQIVAEKKPDKPAVPQPRPTKGI